MEPSAVTPDARAENTRSTWRLRALREVALLAVLYGAYSLARSMADPTLAPAIAVARHLLRIETALMIDVEASFGHLVSTTAWLAVPMSFWYASLHFLATGGVLAWLYVRRADSYPWARNTLVVATACALVLFVLMPTAPPRLVGPPYHDVLAQTSGVGWWPSNGHATAPTGIGNELAAFPSMHAGWALWVALVCYRAAPRWAAVVAWAYALVTAVVVVGTGNHWLLDIVAGWALVALSARLLPRPPATPDDPDGRLPADAAPRVPQVQGEAGALR